MLKCKVLGRNLINGTEKEFDITEGAVFTEYYNETLDSGTIILPQLNAEIQIEPYDIMYIYDTNSKINSRYMCVDTYTCTQTSLDPAIYKYDISLFSLTKMLEGILLPSLSITKSNVDISVRSYLERYINEYGPYLNSDDTGPYTKKFNLSQSAILRFNNIVCPEMQWNEPTLREVITDLMMVDNCIPVVEKGTGNTFDISFMDITQIGSEITTTQRSGINYIQTSQSSADYVSEIKTKIVNSIGEDEKTRICEWITFRNYDTYMLTTENVKVETSYPIWKLNNMIIRVYGNVGVFFRHIGGGQNYSYTASNKVVDGVFYSNTIKDVLEYGEWQTKDIFYEGYQFTVPYSTDYQNTCLYYKRGDKGIFNFNDKVEKVGIFWVPYTDSVLELILNNANNKFDFDDVIDEAIEELEITNPDDYQISANFTNTTFKDLSFYVDYETEGEYSLRISKGANDNDYVPRNQRQIVDNQTQNYVNAKRFGILEYLKANRLGNKVKLINGRYNDSENNIPRLTNCLNSYVIFKKEIAVYDNYLKVNYQATLNYVLRDYFTGIKSKLRSWRIVSGNEAFTRSDIIKFYVNSNLSSISNNKYVLPVYSTQQEYINKFNYCVVKFNLGLGRYLPNHNDIQYDGTDYGVDGYMMEFQKIISGNSVLFTFKALDNAIIGKYVADDNYDIGSGVKGMTQQNCPYVDVNGENAGGIIYFYENYDTSPRTFEDQRALNNLLPAVPTSGVYNSFSNLVAQIPFTFRKDNKEITQITIQFEFNINANDIFLGKK